MSQTPCSKPSLNNLPASTTPRHLENRSYGIKELAVLYFPNITPESASKRLKQWIADSSELLESLAATNYHFSQRIVSPRQMKLIAEAFGEPF